MSAERLQNYIDGSWVESTAREHHTVINPASGGILCETPLCGAEDVEKAVTAAREAFPGWRRVPAVERARLLFKLKGLLDDNVEELAHCVTAEHGKTLPEARGSVKRGIECVEVAAGAPSLLMGQVLEDIATGIDCESVRQPVGVFAGISPFNFPAMVPLWFYPFAVACGNTFVCKPSEQVPLSQKRIFELIDEAGFPPGVLNLVNGGRECAEAIIAHPDVSGVSFVGSSPVAKSVYKEAAARGKRVQALGGAKNFLVVMPDADMDQALDAILESAYGCAGERCLAGSIVLAVGGTRPAIREGLRQRLEGYTVGDGTDASTCMGPLISEAHRERVLAYVEKGIEEGASLVFDGRAVEVPKEGWFMGPCLFEDVSPDMVIAQDEIFGPVLCLVDADDLDSAMEIIGNHPLANAGSIFTTSGRHARDFKYRVPASMAAINLGVAAPMSFFGFGGSKDSFFGDLKVHGREAFDFFTDRKVVISRWT